LKAFNTFLISVLVIPSVLRISDAVAGLTILTYPFRGPDEGVVLQPRARWRFPDFALLIAVTIRAFNLIAAATLSMPKNPTKPLRGNRTTRETDRSRDQSTRFFRSISAPNS
jgi:hypothetical protein